MKKGEWISVAIIILIICFGIFIKTLPEKDTSKEVAKCIGENSIVYTQIGCHACEIQEDLFGKNVGELNIFSCNEDWNECSKKGVTATPTWEIKGEKYVGVQSIEKLKELTGCTDE